MSTPKQKRKVFPSEPTSKRTHSKSENVALQFEAVALLRQEVLNVQLKILNNQKTEQEEQIIHNRKMRQNEVEEARLRQQSLILEIKLKEAQLRALS